MTNPIDTHSGPIYLVWADSTKKLATSTKISNAITCYVNKYGIPPPEILVHESALETKSSVPLRTARFVNEHYFYLPIPDT